MVVTTSQLRQRIAIVSSNETAWGGSEELWHRTALALARAGHEVHIFKPRFPRASARVEEARAAGCKVTDLTRPFGLPGRVFSAVNFLSRLAGAAWLLGVLTIGLWWARPTHVLISQGGNWDGVYFARVVRLLRIPYSIVSQKASEFYWPPDHIRGEVATFYEGATGAYFVSDHNLRLTEWQTGQSIRRGNVVRNPFLVPFDEPLPWPEPGDAVRLACVGRLYPMEKGQDLLLAVLAQEKWKNRPVELRFCGEGSQRDGLAAMAGHLGLTNVRFEGQVTEIQDIWRECEALVLPSRCEGLPLVVVEAMLAGRFAIVTDAGGNRELVEDGVTGFIADAPTIAALDRAMDRAWTRREQWPEIGQAAAKAIRKSIPPDPGAELAASLLASIGEARAP